MRAIPTLLKEYKKSEATTLCQLIKIIAKDGTTIGMTNLDQNIIYHDGIDEVTYYAAIGFQPSSILSTLDMSVDNAEFASLLPEFEFDLNETSINAGVWDYADFIVYEVNYNDLSMGHWIVFSGKLGEMRTVDGINIFGEMRSLSDQLKTNVCQLDSLTCRAKFGSQAGEERFPCGFDASTLWSTGIVDEVGIESNITFTDYSRVEPTGAFEPGLMRWTTGANAGSEVEIQTYIADSSGGTITLSFPTPYTIQPGDQYDIRISCNKRARDTSKGCKFFFGADWINHFRGEPDIPLGDSNNQTPGAGVGPGSGGSTSTDQSNG